MYKENYNLKGKRAFITGDGHGIGLCSADALAETGANIVVSDIDEKLLEEGMSFLRSKNYQVEGFLLNVANSSATEELAEQMEGNFGPVDILVANAGINGPDTSAEKMADEPWQRVLDINLNEVFWSCRTFGKRMVKRQQGAIVTVGSMSGFISNEPQKQVNYNSSKAFVHHLTLSLAGEWTDRGVQVNSVAPAYVNTPMSNITAKDTQYFDVWMQGTPIRRMIEPEEVAAAILFLDPSAASAITGAILPVDAGYTIW